MHLMKSESPHVVLIDWSAGGHDATHFRAFVAALQALGCGVDGVVGQALRERMRAGATPLAEKDYARLQVVDYPAWIRGLRSIRLQLAVRRLRFARRIAVAVARIEKRNGRKADLVFFSSLFEDDLDLAQQAAKQIGRPWSFLNLHPYYFHPAHSRARLNAAAVQRCFAAPDLKAIATINEDVVAAIRSASGKPVVVFPEITDERVDPDHPLKRRVRAFAGDRTTVGIVSLLPWKGVGLLARTCLCADPAKYAFLFAGEYHEANYSRDDAQAFAECLNQAPHALFHLARLPDGPVFNAALDSLDIIFCACENFPFSNNTLTKAALLRKPVIVSENCLSAERVQRHRLGRVVPFGQPEAVQAAIQEIAAGGGVADEDARSYLELHSDRALVAAFSTILNL